MAIYIRTVGIRKLDSIEKEKRRLQKILESTKLDFEFLTKESSATVQFKWDLKETENRKSFELKIFEDSITVSFDNPNFIEFFGLRGWDIREFGNTEENKLYIDGIRTIFKTIAFNYGLEELLYFSEWFFDPDWIRTEEATFQDLDNHIKSNAYLQQPKFWDKWTNGHLIEKVNPVANNGYNL